MAKNRIGVGNDLVLNNGRVGLGTTNPTSKLTVFGDVLISNVGASSSERVNLSSSTSDHGSLSVSGYNGGLLTITSDPVDGKDFIVYDQDGETTFCVATDGNTGIGTTNPTSKLTIDGDARVGFGTDQGIVLTSPNGTQYRIFVDDDGILYTIQV